MEHKRSWADIDSDEESVNIKQAVIVKPTEPVVVESVDKPAWAEVNDDFTNVITSFVKSCTMFVEGVAKITTSVEQQQQQQQPTLDHDEIDRIKALMKSQEEILNKIQMQKAQDKKTQDLILKIQNQDLQNQDQKKNSAVLSYAQIAQTSVMMTDDEKESRNESGSVDGAVESVDESVDDDPIFKRIYSDCTVCKKEFFISFYKQETCRKNGWNLPRKCPSCVKERHLERLQDGYYESKEYEKKMQQTKKFQKKY